MSETYYKVWIDIEEINEDEGTYEDLQVPMSTRTDYRTLEEAQRVQQEIVEEYAYRGAMLSQEDD